MTRRSPLPDIYRAADAILRGDDPAAEVADLPESEQKLAIAIADAITQIPRWHAERISKLPTVTRRRLALGELAPALREQVQTYLQTLWSKRKQRA